MSLLTFLRNSVISLPLITFLIAIIINNYYLVFLSIGLIISGIINHLLKLLTIGSSHKIFIRPSGAKGCSAECGNEPRDGDPGFPSGHAQNAWFFSTFMILYYLAQDRHNPIVIIIYIILALVISFSRLGYIPQLGTLCHTQFQVLVGSGLGIILATIYFKTLFKIFSA